MGLPFGRRVGRDADVVSGLQSLGVGGTGMWKVWAGSWKFVKPRFEFEFCHLLTFLVTLGK